MHLLTVCLSATIQRSISFETLSVNSVNRTKNWREDASGKAVNSARVFNQLRLKHRTGDENFSVSALCPLGKENARHFLDLAQRDQLEIEAFIMKGSTRLCCTLVDQTNHTTTEIICDESAAPADSRTEDEFIRTFKKCLSKADALLIAGSRGSFSEEIYPQLCTLANEKGIPVFADFCGNPLKIALKEARIDCIKINQEEFEKTFTPGLSFTEEEKLLEVLSQWSQKLSSLLVITRGAQSSLAASPDGRTFTCPVQKLEKEELVNTTACGDSFSAGFIYEYLHSKSLEDALKGGTAAAAANARSLIPGSIL